jgi:5'-methylthioadenosine phosphorylase
VGARRPVHLLCKEEDVAERVITAGDPARIEQISKFLSEPRVVNTNRGYLAYTGYYKGKRVTLCSHGIGGPSSAIIFEELVMLGARLIIRLGTIGAMIKRLEIGDFVIPTAAAYDGGAPRMYIPLEGLPAVPDIQLTSAIIRESLKNKVRPTIGVVFSSDAFYAEDPAFVKRWTKLGIIGVEMECATLYILGLLRGFKSASLLIVANSLVDPVQAEFAPAQVLRPYVDKAAEILLNAVVGFPSALQR